LVHFRGTRVHRRLLLELSLEEITEYVFETYHHLSIEDEVPLSFEEVYEDMRTVLRKEVSSMKSITKVLERRHKEREAARKRFEEEKRAFFNEAIEYTKQLIKQRGWSTRDLIFTVVTYSMEPPRFATISIEPKGYRCQRVVDHFKYSEAENAIDEIIEMLCDPDIFVPDNDP